MKDSLRDMIRINRNHPSIIVWSMDNEVFFTEKSTLPKVRTLLKKLVAYSHELDPARPAAIGGCQRGELDRLGDIRRLQRRRRAAVHRTWFSHCGHGIRLDHD